MKYKSIIDILATVLIALATIIGILKIVRVTLVAWYVIQSIAYHNLAKAYLDKSPESDEIERSRMYMLSFFTWLPAFRHMVLINTIRSKHIKVLGISIEKQYMIYTPLIYAIIIFYAKWKYKFIGLLIRAVILSVCYKHIYAEMENKEAIQCIPLAIISSIVGIVPVWKFNVYRKHNKLPEIANIQQ